jgi:D-sedoheptulose 7-phosphate isomerase
MKNLTQKLNKDLKASLDAKKTLLKSSKKIGIAIKKIVSNLKTGGKIMLCGNGGSAADAQHLAAEFLVRLRPNFNRSPLPALTLATDTSTITACGNDYKFTEIFSRNLEALGKKNDILIAISTSGNSKNIIEVLKKAKRLKIFSIGFLGNSGGKAKNLCNLPIIIESKNTARIQEAHIFLGHFVMINVEDLLFKKKDK